MHARIGSDLTNLVSSPAVPDQDFSKEFEVHGEAEHERLDQDGPAAEEDVDLSGAEFHDRRRHVPSVGPELPLRNLAKGVRQDLHEFIHTNLRPAAGFGFMTANEDPVSVDRMMDTFKNAIEKLEVMVNDTSGEASPESITLRGMSANMQANCEEFLVGLTRGSFKGGVSDHELDTVLHSAIAMKQQLSQFILQLDALKAGFQVS